MAFSRDRVGRLHRQPARDQRRARTGGRRRAARRQGGESSGPASAPLIFGGDLNLRPAEDPEVFDELARALRADRADRAEGDRSPLGARPRTSRRPPRGRRGDASAARGRALRLSDHAPVEARFANDPPVSQIEIFALSPLAQIVKSRRQATSRWPTKKAAGSEKNSKQSKAGASETKTAKARKTGGQEQSELAPKPAVAKRATRRKAARRAAPGSTKASPSFRESARAQRHAEPRPHPGGRRRRGQTRPDDPRRRREDDRRAAQTRPQTDRLAALRAGETGPPGAQETRRPARSRTANRRRRRPAGPQKLS